MNIAVRYQSRGGNTRAVAEVIAREAGTEAEPIDVPLTGHVDILFLGGGVYAWDADKGLIEYLKHLRSQSIGMIADFSTARGMSVTNKRIREYAQKAGIKICDKGLCLKILLQGHSALKREGGHLTEGQAEKVRIFANDILNGQG